MSQTNIGSVSLTAGSSLVTASADVDWSGYQNGMRVFWVSGSNASYQVAAVRAPNLNASGRWELNLVANYSGATAVGAPYYLSNSFSVQLELPLLAYGDAQGNVMFSRAMLRIESLIVGIQNANPSKLGTADAANIKVDNNGNLMIRNVTTGTYKYLIAQGAEGAESLVLLDTYP